MSVMRALEDLILAAFTAFAVLGWLVLVFDMWSRRGER